MPFTAADPVDRLGDDDRRALLRIDIGVNVKQVSIAQYHTAIAGPGRAVVGRGWRTVQPDAIAGAILASIPGVWVIDGESSETIQIG